MNFAVPCHAMPCHAMPCHAMPCHAMPCHAMPCSAIPCHAMPRDTKLMSLLKSGLKSGGKPCSGRDTERAWAQTTQCWRMGCLSELGSALAALLCRPPYRPDLDMSWSLLEECLSTPPDSSAVLPSNSHTTPP